MIPVIDLQASDALDRIDEAYTTVGFAVFTNALSDRRAGRYEKLARTNESVL